MTAAGRPATSAAWGWLRKLLAVLAIQAALTNCSTPGRLSAVPQTATARADPGLGTIRFQVRNNPPAFEREATASLAKERAWLASQGQVGALPPVSFLAISGGGDNGAFAAGFLNGWTASGTRPEFKAVTGVSTGALIAPFAFLGPKYDHVLTTVYTTINKDNIFKKRGIIKSIFSDAMADSKPMAKLVERYADRALLDAIAAEYAKGRLLLVGTTDLDALEPVIWNMTAIAASKDPRALPLFRNILLASASIPGAFPPVMIDVTADGVRHQEMHVDGGTVAQVFLYPPAFDLSSMSAAAGAQRKRTLYIIRNARLDPDWTSVERRTLPVAARAIASLTQAQGVGDLYRIYLTTVRDGLDYNLAYIPPSFTVLHKEEFDTAYMRQLYAVGQSLAVSGYKWSKYPPGYSPPR